MNRSEVRSQSSRPGQHHGGFLKGFLIGLVCGVILSAGVAIYVMRMPNPFVKRTDSVANVSEKPINDMPDISKHGLINPTTVEGSNGTAGAVINAPSTATPSAIALPEPVTTNTESNPIVIAPGGSPSTDNSKRQMVDSPLEPPKETKPAPSSFLVQTGAFNNVHDADDQRASLALLGIDAHVIPPSANQNYYRVRIGPMSTMSEVHSLLANLKNNGFKKNTLIKDNN